MVDYSKSTLGSTLLECRTISGMTLNEAATASGVSLTRLLGIESGKTGPTKEILRDLMTIYGPAIQSLHVVPADERRRATTERAEIDWLSLMMRSEEMSNRELLADVATAVRTLRGLSTTVPVNMRTPEADLLVSMLDLTDPELAVTIVQEYGLSITEVKDFIAGAVNRAQKRAGGCDSEYLRRLKGIEYPADLADVR